MVISSVEPDRDTYRLYIPFHYPSSGYGVAVSANFANNVVSAYTIFIQLIIVQTWGLLVLLGLRMSVRSLRDTDEPHPNPPSHNTALISVGILNSNGLEDIALLALGYLWKLRKEASTRSKLLFWLVMAVIGALAHWGLPIVAAPYLVLGQAAPVNPARIYSPDLSGSTSNISIALNVANLITPAALRAVGSAQVANATVRDQVQIGNKEILKDLGDGESILRINYGYSITGQDFGLQGFPDLQLTVEGSCQSDYQLFDQSFQVNDITTDMYTIPDQGPQNQNASQNVSSAVDGSRPLAYFFLLSENDTSTQTNFSYLLLFSTVGRESFTQGSDPFYLTTNSTQGPDQAFVVLPGRPVLSCWQVDSLINRGISYSYQALQTPTNLPITISSILVSNLAGKIVKLGSILGPSALASAADSSVGPFFDAGAADIKTDLSRLILTSYISTMNTFTDLTTFSNTTAIPNLIPPQNLTDAARFVLFSTAVTALSIPMLIAVPVVMVVWIGVLFILKHCFQSHWLHLKAMGAEILFECLSNEMRKNDSRVQDDSHEGMESGNRPVFIIPKHKGEDLFWIKTPLSEQQPSPQEKAPPVEVVPSPNSDIQEVVFTKS